MGNVSKGPAMHNGRGAFQGLDQVGVHRVPQQSGHCALGFDIPCINRLALIIVGNEDVAQPLLQIRHILGQTQDGHNLAGYGDNEVVLPGHAVDFATQAHNHIAQGPVVHV